MARLTINRGTTYTINYEYRKNDLPASLVGATVYFTVKANEYDDSVDDATAIIKKDITDHIDAANGLSQIVIEPADTSGLVPKVYYYDLKVKEADDTIYKTDEGTVKIDGSPTNRTS